MPNTTPRLGLKKPLGTEVVDITVLNDNADTLDLNVAKKADFDAHTANTSNPHNVTTTQIGAETPTGAQTKVDTHAADSVKHITSAERTTWNGKQDAIGFTPVNVATYNNQVNQDVRTTASPSFAGLTLVGTALARTRLNGTQLEYWNGTGWVSMTAIKSVQRGVTASANGTVNVTLSSVDTSKTMVNLLSTTIYETGTLTATGVYLQLTSSTNLAITSNSNYSISWEVIEYA